ncbi:MAG: toll/interleukin-1 receptor domain-containing protein [Porphyromonadaceae bacterium]|nr:MAG: toll/interleukin-1 receptor domain-containing protein [Porphyromonadaceae bacterium]
MDPHFFISFSSRDLRYAREILAAIENQGISIWDYSDIIQSIELGQAFPDRLRLEIDRCSHLIFLISRNSIDPVIGRFCRYELEYVRGAGYQKNRKIIPVVADPDINPSNLAFPFDLIKDAFYLVLTDRPESIVKLTVKVCQLIDKQYIPPITAHSHLPFWEFFRREVFEMAHSNKYQVDLMMILGEFNENYRQQNQKEAHFLITHFINSCRYRIKSYTPFYPIIVKAVCETELGLYSEALKSYHEASVIQPYNQDVIGGMGTVLFKTQRYQEALECFEQILRHDGTEYTRNARINLIITKLAMEQNLTESEIEFLFITDVISFPDDLKTNVFNARGLVLRVRKSYSELEQLCRSVISQNLHDTITIILLYLSLYNRGRQTEAARELKAAMEESDTNPRIDKSVLKGYLILFTFTG